MDGTKIVELRKKHGLTQMDLAKILNVSKTSICNWEKEDFNPKINVVIEMAQYFKVSVSYLINEEAPALTKEEKIKLADAAEILERISK